MRSPLLALAAAGTLLLACSEPPGSAPDVEPAPAPAASEAEAAASEPEPLVPLESLLELPADFAVGGREGPLVWEPPGRDAEADSTSREQERALRIESTRSSERSQADPERTYESTDVGASLQVDEKTRVRGGVRVEREVGPEGARQPDTAPTIAVERRF